MNSLEAEYSFLAPTWRLPPVATKSMYAPNYGTSYQPNSQDIGPDWALWNNASYNPRYIPTYAPSIAARRNYPLAVNYQPPVGRLTLSGPPNDQQTDNLYENNPNNEYNYNQTPRQTPRQTVNRGETYATNVQNNPYPPPPPPANQKRRVQIIDHNRHTPSTIVNDYPSSRQSHYSTNEPSVPQQNHTSETNRSKPPTSHQSHEHTDDNRHGHNGNNSNIHEFLYGLPAPDPGSYANAYKQHQRRLQDEKLGRKSVMNEYKAFVQNGGFGPTFGSTNNQSYVEKIEHEKRRKTYSRAVRETNNHKLEEQKRIQNINGHPKTRPAPVPKHQRFDVMTSDFLPKLKAREYAETIEKPHHLKPVSETIANLSPMIIKSLLNNRRRSSIESIHSLNLTDLESNENNINRLEQSSSSLSLIKTSRHVRFHNRVFIRSRSSTIIDLPTPIIGKSILNRAITSSTCSHTEQTVVEIKDEQPKIPMNFSSSSNEKKSIISHSMLTAKNMRLPPTATVVINELYKPLLHATTSTNNQSKKSIVNKAILPSQHSLTAHSIPIPYWKTTILSSELDFNLQIKSFHPTDDSSNK